MPRVVGGLAATDLLPGKDDLVAGFSQERFRISHGSREDQVAEAGGEELDRHPRCRSFRIRSL